MESGGQAHQSKKRHAKYLPHNAQALKRRKEAGLTPAVSGFFITCDAGRHSQASTEAINLLHEFHGRLLNASHTLSNVVEDHPQAHPQLAHLSEGSQAPAAEATHVQAHKPGPAASTCSISDLLEREINELQDPKKAMFAALDTGCNGVIFIRMLAGGDENDLKCPNPNDLVDAIMQEAITSEKPLTRYCFKVLPVEITCYASPDELKKAAERIILHHFPEDGTSYKFAVVYDARANSGANRMQFIDTVAKLVPKPHTVDLKKPDKTIIVQVVKTICTFSVVKNYKEHFRYNLRQMAFQKRQT